MMQFMFIISTVIIFLILAIILRKYLPKWFVCDLMGWHSEVEIYGNDGMSCLGKCKKCGKYVMMDSQGNWF